MGEEIETLKKEVKRRQEKTHKIKIATDLSQQVLRSQYEDTQQELERTKKDLESFKDGLREAQGQTKQLKQEIETLNAKLIEKENTKKIEFTSEKGKNLQEALLTEKNIREQLQSRLHTLEKELSVLQRDKQTKEIQNQKLRESRLQEIKQAGKSSTTVLMEEKHLLEDKIEQLKKEIDEGRKIREELESAF